MSLVGGDKLEAALTTISRRLAKAQTVRVGFLEGATYPDGTSVPLVAAVQEFGAPSKGIPPRPYFRSMIERESAAWPRQLGVVLKVNDYDAAVSLGIMGELIAGELRQSIVDLKEPPLKPATIRRKGFSTPLIDTGHLLGSVSSEVVE